MSGGSDKPVPGKTQTKEKTTTAAKTAGTTTPTLPDWMTAGLKTQFGEYTGATDQFGNAIEDWSAAPFDPNQTQAFDMARAAATGPYMQLPLEQMLATARGDYLYGGEGFNAAVDAAYRAGKPGVLSQFGGMGRDENFLGKASLGQIYSDAFANQYGAERGRQLQAAQLLPGMSLLPAQTFENIGKQYQNLAQYEQNYPLESLYPQYFSALQGATGFASPFQGQQTTGQTTGKTTGVSRGIETPSYFPGNQTAGLAGGILSGAGTGAMMTPGMPWLGAIGGGILGGVAQA